MNRQITSIFLLRMGLAFAFIYVAISAFYNPSAWIGFIPEFARSVFSADILLIGHLAVNSIIGLWLIFGWKTFWAAVVSALNLFSIIIFNLASFDIVFRDVSILVMAVVLAILTYRK